MSIKGSIPAYALYGEPVSGIRSVYEQNGSKMAPPSGPYLGRGNKCSAKDDTCEGNRVKDEVFCAGHLRSVMSKSKVKVVEVKDGV